MYFKGTYLFIQSVMPWFESIIGSFLLQVNNQASLFLSDNISEDDAEVSLTELKKLEYVLKQVDHW